MSWTTDRQSDHGSWSCLWFSHQLSHTLEFYCALWILVHKMDHGPSKWSWSVKLSMVFTPTFSKSGISPCSLEFCSRAGPRIVKKVTVYEVVRGLYFKFGSSKSSYCNHIAWSISQSVKWTTDRQDGHDFLFLYIFFQHLPDSSCLINKHIKS